MYKKTVTLFSIILTVALTVAANSPLPSRDGSDASLLAAIDFTNVDRLVPPHMDAMDSDDEAARLSADMLQYARQYIGTRYRHGGKTPGGFDCSGFTGHVFRQFGYSLGASSREQFRDGIAVDNDAIQPGDLLFFKGRSSKSIGHVGIAIENNAETGEITFIHAAIKGGIRIDRTTAPYYARRFVGARRIIQP